MPRYNVLVSKSAIKQIKMLDKKFQEKIKSVLNELENDPFQSRSGADIKKLHKISKSHLYRIRIGKYSIVYNIDNNNVKIARIFLRERGYEWLD